MNGMMNASIIAPITNEAVPMNATTKAITPNSPPAPAGGPAIPTSPNSTRIAPMFGIMCDGHPDPAGVAGRGVVGVQQRKQREEYPADDRGESARTNER